MKNETQTIRKLATTLLISGLIASAVACSKTEVKGDAGGTAQTQPQGPAQPPASGGNTSTQPGTQGEFKGMLLGSAWCGGTGDEASKLKFRNDGKVEMSAVQGDFEFNWALDAAESVATISYPGVEGALFTIERIDADTLRAHGDQDIQLKRCN